MNKDLALLETIDKYITLYDFYKALLTEKQCTYFEEYYFQNMSLQEIATYYNVSRNAIFDQIQKTVKLLENYEAKLNLVSTYHKTCDIYDKYLNKKNVSLDTIKLINELKELE